MSFTGEEISNLDAISLSNCPKLSDNPRIKTVEYTVIGRGPVSIEGQKEVGCPLRICNFAADTENAPPDSFSSFRKLPILYAIANPGAPGEANLIIHETS